MLYQKDLENYVNKYLKTNSLDDKITSLDKTIIEIAIEIGEYILYAKHPDLEHWTAAEFDGHTLLFPTDSSHDLFESYYDQVLLYLIKHTELIQLK